jgi:hypothetical protein
MFSPTDSEPWYHNFHNVAALLRLIGYALIAVAAVGGGWWHKRKEKIALAWPSVEGCVRFVSVAPTPKSSAYIATLQYSYFVGEYQSGEYTEVFDSEYDANDFVEKMKDQKVPVRYNPKEPDKSLIEEADVEQYIQLSPPERMAPLR